MPQKAKQAMDAVNEALLKPTEYPAADQDYDHPTWFKGTEPEQIKHASDSRSYEEIAGAALTALRDLVHVAVDEDVRACAEMSLGDLEFFLKRERESRNSPNPAPHLSSVRGRRPTAAIEIHTGPQNGGNPNLIGRSYLDEDLKEDLNEEKDQQYKHFTGKTSLLLKKNGTSGRLSRSR